MDSSLERQSLTASDVISDGEFVCHTPTGEFLRASDYVVWEVRDLMRSMHEQAVYFSGDRSSVATSHSARTGTNRGVTAKPQGILGTIARSSRSEVSGIELVSKWHTEDNNKVDIARLAVQLEILEDMGLITSHPDEWSVQSASDVDHKSPLHRLYSLPGEQIGRDTIAQGILKELRTKDAEGQARKARRQAAGGVLGRLGLRRPR